MNTIFQILQLLGIFVIGTIIFFLYKRNPKLVISVGIALVILLAVVIALAYLLPG